MPALKLGDFFDVDEDDRGRINILAADKPMHTPRLYSIFVMWLLWTLVDELPEVGDLDKPRLAFFIDEAHLLFADASAAILTKVRPQSITVPQAVELFLTERPTAGSQAQQSRVH